MLTLKKMTYRTLTDARLLAAELDPLAVHAPTARATLNDLLENVPKMREAATRLAPPLHAAEGASPG